MITTDADPVNIKLALWHLIKDAGVSNNIRTSNRPDSSKWNDFVVVDINGFVTDRDGYARCVCLVQLFAKDIDQNGTENLEKLSSMYSTLVNSLPYNTAPYTFSKKNQVGSRDALGFHATLVNLDCLIY